MESRRCVHTFGKNEDQAVYALAFSPNGHFLASGSFGGRINVWDIKTGALVKLYRHAEENSGIFELNWYKTGDKIAACHSNSKVSILDFQP